MDNTILELTERLGIDSARAENRPARMSTTANGKSALHVDSSEEDTVNPPTVNRTRDNRPGKIQLFCQRYKRLLVLVFKSIGPDLKSFKCWQIIILSLFAAFNVIFSVLVGGL